MKTHGTAGQKLILSAVILAMALASGGLASAQVHGAPTTAAPPGLSTVKPPGPPGLPATSSPAANAASAINPATAVAPGQPPIGTNVVGQVTPPTTDAAGATTASGAPITTDVNGLSTTTNAANASTATNAAGTTLTSGGSANAAATNSTTTSAPQVAPAPVNAIGMPTARTPFTPAAPGTVAPSSAQNQSQATGR